MILYKDAVIATFKSLTCQRKTQRQNNKPPKTSPPSPHSPAPTGTSASSSRTNSRTSSATLSIRAHDQDLDTDSEDGGCRCWFRSTKHRAGSKKQQPEAPRPSKCCLSRKTKPTVTVPDHKHHPKHHHGGHGHCHHCDHHCQHLHCEFHSQCHHGHKGKQCHAPQLACPIGNAVMNYLLDDGPMRAESIPAEAPGKQQDLPEA